MTKQEYVEHLIDKVLDSPVVNDLVWHNEYGYIHIGRTAEDIVDFAIKIADEKEKQLL